MIIPVSILVLGVIGVFAAIILFFAAKKFWVYENPLIGQVEEILPGANCGGCGFSGCHAFAVECANAKTMDGLVCTSLDSKGMEKVAEIVGLKPFTTEKKIAMVKCGANCETRKQVNVFDGVTSCQIMAFSYQGESNCVYGCLGCGDCVKVCPFGGMTINPTDRVARVNIEKCTGCGKCVEACPRNLCVLIPYKPELAMVWVACSNKDKGPLAMKECGISCIGCGKCRKVCPTLSPAIESFLATINQEKCISCGACISACPRKCIFSNNENFAIVPQNSETLAQ